MGVSRFVSRAVIVAAGLSTSSGWAVADTFEQVAPDVPKSQRDAPEFLLPERANAVESDEVLVQSLSGLLFVQSPADVVPDGLAKAGVDVGSIDMLSDEETLSSLRAYLGRPLTLKLLDEIVAVTVQKFRAENRPFVDVIVPPQDITSGSVQILVLEFVTGEVRADGAFRTPSEELTAMVRAKPGRPLNVEELTDDLDWLNRSMFRTVELVLERGDAFGETDLVLDVEEKSPWRIYVSMDNTGSRATGRERYLLGGNFGDVFFSDALLSYQYTSSRDLVSDGRAPFGLTSRRPAYAAHSFDYSVPFSDRSVLSVFGFHAESRPNLGRAFSSIAKSWQLSARYQFPLMRVWDMRHRFSAGFDFKRTNNNLGFGGTVVSNSNTDVAQMLFGWSADSRDEWGGTLFGASLAFSPGGLSAFNDDGDYQPSATAVGRRDAKSRFVVLRADMDRSFELPESFFARIRANAQISSTNLMPSEQILAGGSRTVRGFEENETAGDHGIVGSLEIGSQGWPVLGHAFDVPDSGRAYGFLDRGDVWLNTTGPGEVRQNSLMSVGVGFAYQLGSHLSFDIAHGWQLDGRHNNSAKAERTHVRFVLSF